MVTSRHRDPERPYAPGWNGQITSLLAEREALTRVSTWPWEPATLTGFLTTLVLPRLLWGLQHLVERAGL